MKWSFLIPLRDYSTIYVYIEGNPFLKPSIINNFEIGHTFNNFLNTTLSYPYFSSNNEVLFNKSKTLYLSKYKKRPPQYSTVFSLKY